MEDNEGQPGSSSRRKHATNSNPIAGPSSVKAAKKRTVNDPPQYIKQLPRKSVSSSEMQKGVRATKSSAGSMAPPSLSAARKFPLHPQEQPAPPVFATKAAHRIVTAAKSTRFLNNRASLAPSLGQDRAQGQFFPGETNRRRYSTPFPAPIPAAHQQRLMLGRKSIPGNPNQYPFSSMGVAPMDSQSSRRRSLISHMTPSDVTPVKSTKLLAPSWHAEDDARNLGNRAPAKRARDESGSRMASTSDLVPRMSIGSISTRDGPRGPARHSTLDTHSNNRPKAYIRPGMSLEVRGDDGRINEASPPAATGDPRPQSTKAARKNQFGQKLLAKSVNPRSVEIDASDESENAPPSESSDEIEELRYDGGRDSEASDDDRSRHSFSPPEVPMAGSPRPLSPPEIPSETPPAPSSAPSEELLEALEALTLTSARLQKTHQLPFLLRNLRRGFEHRCSLVKVPTKARSKDISVSVLYRYAASNSRKEHAYQARMVAWLCPLCELHGKFRTRDMLERHLDWDHHEIGVKWEQDGREAWRIILKIPVPKPEGLQVAPRADNEPSDLIPQPAASPVMKIASPIARRPISIAKSTTRYSASTELSPAPPKFKFRETSPTPSRASSQVHSVRARSTTAISVPTQRRSASSRYPTPPPQSDPHGPSAQPPYLPAKSEFGGPDIHYSCRPGGPRLYDLLNTLPMAPYGVLAWSVLDREEEIFESDDIKDEYKVMHALWARWIMLNRNKFIADFYLGTIAFVDEYWRMIHRAAGWDAMRYWLLMLLANRFITGPEVAKILRRYEGLTGMDQWYDF